MEKLLSKSPITFELLNPMVNSQSSSCLIYQQCLTVNCSLPWYLFFIWLLRYCCLGFLLFSVVTSFLSPLQISHLWNVVMMEYRRTQFLNPLLCLDRLSTYPNSLGDLNWYHCFKYHWYAYDSQMCIYPLLEYQITDLDIHSLLNISIWHLILKMSTTKLMIFSQCSTCSFLSLCRWQLHPSSCSSDKLNCHN